MSESIYYDFASHDNRSAKQLAIAWIGLKHTVKIGLRSVEKIVLNDVNGSIDFKTMTAIMGPSGAGKTTLLECISGRQTNGFTEFSQFYTNQNVEIKSCFIVQEVKEHLLNGLTTLQSLIYASKLKNRSKGFNHELNARNLLMSFNITNTANTSVEKCSGGQQKRIAIALELTAEEKPNLLCIDEPTSGLDSCAAEEMIKCLKDLTVRDRISVVTSIHQPSYDIISQFDKLYVMAIGGQCVFDGHPNDISDHLTNVEVELDNDEEPLEVLIRMSSIADHHVIQRIADQTRSNRTVLEDRCSRYGCLSVGIVRKNTVFSLTQVWYLLVRTMIHIYRSRIILDVIQVFTFLMIGLTYSLLIGKDIGRPDGCIDPKHPPLCNESEADLKNDQLLDQNTGAFFYTLDSVHFLIFPSAILLTHEIAIYICEINNGWYGTGTLFLVTNIVELPSALFISMGSSTIIYKMTHQIDEGFRFWSYVATTAGIGLIGQGYGLLVSICWPRNTQMAVTGALAFFMIGLFTNTFTVPSLVEATGPLRWLTYLSYHKLCYDMLMYLVYGFHRCPDELTPKLLWQLSMDDLDQFYLNRNILIIHLIFNRIMVLVVLLIKTRRK